MNLEAPPPGHRPPTYTPNGHPADPRRGPVCPPPNRGGAPAASQFAGNNKIFYSIIFTTKYTLQPIYSWFANGRRRWRPGLSGPVVDVVEETNGISSDAEIPGEVDNRSVHRVRGHFTVGRRGAPGGWGGAPPGGGGGPGGHIVGER